MPGVWGSCTGSSGTIDLPVAVSLKEDAEVRGRLLVQLQPCDEIALGVYDVTATFDVTLERGIEELCPDF